MSENVYDGPANLCTSVGDSFATCHLVAQREGDGWSGQLTEILFRTQMVPFPLNDKEWLRIDGAEGKPLLQVDVRDAEGEEAKVSAEGNPFG